MTKERLQEIKNNIARLEISGEAHISHIGLEISDVVFIITALEKAWAEIETCRSVHPHMHKDLSE